MRFPQQFPEELDEPGDGPQDDEDDVKEMSPKQLVQQVSHQQPRDGAGWEQERQFQKPGGLSEGGFFAAGHSDSLAARALRRLVHQETHPGMGRLEIGLDSEFLQGLGGGWTDGGDQSLAQTVEHLPRDALGLRNPE